MTGRMTECLTSDRPRRRRSRRRPSMLPQSTSVCIPLRAGHAWRPITHHRPPRRNARKEDLFSCFTVLALLKKVFFMTSIIRIHPSIHPFLLLSSTNNNHSTMKTTSSILPLLLLASLAWFPQDACGFVVGERPVATARTTSPRRRPVLSLADKSTSMKSYDSDAVSPRKDVMDSDAAMREFFQGAAEDWKPLFRSLTTNTAATAAAMSLLKDADLTNFEFTSMEESKFRPTMGIAVCWPTFWMPSRPV
jgi:hypothetical protein